MIRSSVAAGESALESDLLGGSFFTHHLVAGLRGIADSNRDGRVTVSEAYRYASDRTVVSSASTLSGIQHPTFLFDIKGRSRGSAASPPARASRA